MAGTHAHTTMPFHEATLPGNITKTSLMSLASVNNTLYYFSKHLGTFDYESISVNDVVGDMYPREWSDRVEEYLKTMHNFTVGSGTAIMVAQTITNPNWKLGDRGFNSRTIVAWYIKIGNFLNSMQRVITFALLKEDVLPATTRNEHILNLIRILWEKTAEALLSMNPVMLTLRCDAVVKRARSPDQDGEPAKKNTTRLTR